MLESIAIGFAVFPVAVIYSSLAEWVIHGTFMHRPLARFRHFYHGHAEVHHGIYRADSTYVVGDRAPREITLAWWAMPFPVLAHAPFLIAIAVWVSVPSAIAILGALTLYQATYEYIHYCMHVPSNRWFEQTSAYKWLNAHHLQHHLKHNTNLNIVLPIFDYLLGTRQKLSESARAVIR